VLVNSESTSMTNNVVSLYMRSNGSGSSVEDPPLPVVVWLMIIDVKVVVGVPEKGSIGSHP